MNLPISFLAGIAVVLLHGVIDDALPGSADLAAFWPYVALLPIPWLLARYAGARLHSALLHHGTLTPALAASVRLPGAIVPVVYACLVLGGGLPEVAAQLAPRSQFLQHALLLGPLVAMEFSVRFGEARTARWIDAWGTGGPGGLGPMRLPMTVFVLTPILVFSAVADLAFRDRRVEVFFSGTTLGSSLGLVVAALGLSVALPLLFRWTLPTSTRLPPHVDADVRTTARQLDFPDDSILTLHTSHRVVNAAMVGPFAWPRYLVLSDGLLALLDRWSLRGVVAHEIGHARAKHPLLLLLVFVLVPILLLQPLLSLDLGTADPLLLAIGGGLALAALVWAVRRMAHRFEYEADEQSAQALGEIGPCIDALRRVSELHPGHRHRTSFRHPSEQQRIAHLEAWARDPEYRNTQRRRGRRVRAAVALTTLLAIVVSAIVHQRRWPLDRAVYLLYSGDFGAAEQHLAALRADPPLIRQQDIDELRLEAAAALELVGPGGPDMWPAFRADLGKAAWTRAVEVLVAAGPAAARPWLALALGDSDDSPLERCLYALATAAADGDADRAAVVREHLLTLDLPERVGDALRAWQPAAR